MTNTSHDPTDAISAAVPTRLRVAACVGTYRRNDPLRVLLERLAEIGEASSDRFSLAVVIVDDNPDGAAEPVVRSFEGRFPLGVHYRRCGKQNISLVRNLLLETAMEIADVLVMTDDDCLPEPQWIDALLDTRSHIGADAVSGPMITDVHPEAAAWITEQEVFAHDDQSYAEDGTTIPIGQTNNCLIDLAWLRANSDHRFDPAFGRIGGEDMVFFSGATARGLRSVYSARARVHAVEPLDELGLWALVKSRYWWGNSEAVTNNQTGEASRPRLVLRGGRRMTTALARPFTRVARRQPPHLRFTLLQVVRAAGLLTGALGVRVRHH